MAASEPPYRFETGSGYTVVVIQPQLNDSQWADFEAVGNELLNRLGDVKPPAVLIDLSGLSYMGSAMVALIVRLWKSIRERGGKMVVINRHEMVYEVMKLAGLNNVWTIVPDRDQALKALGKRSSSGSGEGSGNMLLALGVVGIVVAAVGLAMAFGVIPVHVTAKVSTAITVAGAMLGLVGGAVTAARGSGGAKSAGILIAIVSAAILIVGILFAPPNRAAASDAPAPKEESAGAQPSGNASTAAEDDRESKRKTRKEKRAEDSAASNPALGDAAKTAEQAKAAEAKPSLIDIGSTPPAAEPAPADAKNAAETKEGAENAPKKAVGGFGSLKLNLKGNEKKE